MKKWSLLILVLFSSGCMHAGSVKGKTPSAKPEVTASLLSETVVKGKTSKEELLAKLGPPNSLVKNPYHVPTVPGLKMEVPPSFRAVETWNYWTYDKFSSEGAEHAMLYKIYIDDTGHALDYEVSEAELKNPGF